jgi:hypothetical protein
MMAAQESGPAWHEIVRATARFMERMGVTR